MGMFPALRVSRRAKGCDEHGESAHLKSFKFVFKDKKIAGSINLTQMSLEKPEYIFKSWVVIK